MPSVIYADFECLVEPLSGCQPNPEKCFTNQYQKHKMCGFCFHVKCSFDEKYTKTKTYRMKNEDEDITKIFVEMMEDDITRIQNIPPKPMILTQNDWQDFKKAKRCWICQTEFEENEKKSEITVTSLGNTEEQLTIYAISNSKSHGSLQ